MKICSRCGYQNTDNSNYCEKCGQQLLQQPDRSVQNRMDYGQQGAQEQNRMDYGQQQTQRRNGQRNIAWNQTGQTIEPPKKKKTGLIIAVVIFVAVVLLLVTAFLFRDKVKEVMSEHFPAMAAEQQEPDKKQAKTEPDKKEKEAATDTQPETDDVEKQTDVQIDPEQSLADSARKEDDTIELTDYIGNFDKAVEIMDMSYDNEEYTYYIDKFKLIFGDDTYLARNDGNAKVSMYGICIGDNRADVLPEVQEYGYTYRYSGEDSDAIHLLYQGKFVYMEIQYENEQVTAWYINNYEEGDIEFIKDILKVKEQYDLKNAEPWKMAYIDFIAENCMNYDSFLCEYMERYKLINVNGGDIPELYVNFGHLADGDLVCSYYDNAVIYEYTWNYGCSYIEGENLFMDFGGQQGLYHNIVYSIENGAFVEKGKGEYEMDQKADVPLDPESNSEAYHYYWNGNEVSGKAEYEALLREIYNEESAKTPYENDEIYGYLEIMEQIAKY